MTERLAVGKCPVAHEENGCGQLDFEKSCASLKCSIADFSHPLGNVHLGDSHIVSESLVADGGDCGRDDSGGTAQNKFIICRQDDGVAVVAGIVGLVIFIHHQGGEAVATVEDALADDIDTLGDDDFFKLGASFKGMVAYLDDAFGEGDGFQRFATFERLLADASQTGEIAQFVETDEGIDVLENVGEAEHGLCLCLAQLAIFVGIPVVHTDFLGDAIVELDDIFARCILGNADDGTLVEGVAAFAGMLVFIGVEQGELEIAVAFAAPAPVDVVEAVAVIAVADKAMAALGRKAEINNGPTA